MIVTPITCVQLELQEHTIAELMFSSILISHLQNPNEIIWISKFAHQRFTCILEISC